MQSSTTKRRMTDDRPKICYFCSHGITDIDYKDTATLQKFISNYMKILPRKRTGMCARHQRQFATAVKRARHLAMLPFTNRG